MLFSVSAVSKILTTCIVAGAGLTGDATSGDATLAVGAGYGITVNADDIEVDIPVKVSEPTASRFTWVILLAAGLGLVLYGVYN